MRQIRQISFICENRTPRASEHFRVFSVFCENNLSEESFHRINHRLRLLCM